LLQEDVGKQRTSRKKSGNTPLLQMKLKQICSHDATRFLNGGTNFLTQDEEGSGIIDVQEILGAGMFLMVDQAHYTITGDAVEGGQLLALFNPDTYNACASYTGNISVLSFADRVRTGSKYYLSWVWTPKPYMCLRRSHPDFPRIHIAGRRKVRQIVSMTVQTQPQLRLINLTIKNAFDVLFQ
jgi:hypothetical protein